MNAEKLVTAYIKIRNARQKLQHEFDEADDKLKQQIDLVEQALLELCKEMGTDGLRTQAGSVTRMVKTRYWTTDWASMKAFIKEHDALELLEQRVHQTNMKSFLEDNPDLMPQGMSIDSKYSITVKKPRGK